MAGFVSSAEQWKIFDLGWRKCLLEAELTHFHMVDYAHSTGEFKVGWKNQERRRALLSDLLDLIRLQVWRKVGVVIDERQFADDISDQSHSEFASTSIALAGKLVYAEIENWRLNEHFSNRAEMVFEDGDNGKGTLNDALFELTGQRPIFRPKKDNTERGLIAFTPLQAADVFAYEIQKICTDNPESFAKKGFRFRYPYEQLRLLSGEAKIANLQKAETWLHVDRYFNKKPLI